jgi:very-short-patch-repair endonuclease
MSATAAEVADLLELQCGVLSRRQALGRGLTDEYVSAQIGARRWQRVYDGVYATFTGDLDLRQRVWAAVLVCGPGAMASHVTAGQLDGLVELSTVRDERIHVTVPGSRRVVGPDGICVHYARDAAQRRHPSLTPPRTRIEETVLDLWEQTRELDRALALVAAAGQRRLTTADRVLATARRRTRLRRRPLLEAVLSDVAEGAHSLLELRHLRDVERAHGLPRGRRQRRADRHRRWTDVLHHAYRTVIELDGALWHAGRRLRDRRRDNAHVVGGRAVLRYGWEDVCGEPCGVAGEVAAVLRLRGWTGRPRRCGPSCTMVVEGA